MSRDNMAQVPCLIHPDIQPEQFTRHDEPCNEFEYQRYLYFTSHSRMYSEDSMAANQEWHEMGGLNMMKEDGQ